MPWKGIGATIAAFVVSLIALGRASSIVVDWAWFSSVGYVGVFWTAFATKTILFVTIFAVSAFLLWINARLALRLARPLQLRLPATFGPGFAPSRGPASLLLPWRLLILAGALIIALLVALAEMGKWDLILRFIYQVPYGQNDPLFDKDIGFYLFSLPVYVALKNWMMLMLLLSSAMAGAVYVLHGEINLDSRRWRFSPVAIAHGSALLGLYFAVKAWSYVLDRYLLLYNDNGVVVGAGYTDVHIELPVLWLLIGLSAAAAVVMWTNMWLRTYRLVIAAVALMFGSAFLFGELLPGMFQRFFVKPSELQLEAPYIQRNIALTREAYNLRQITVKPFPAEQGLTFQSLEDNRGTIDNIRLWDWQPLMDTYAQLQEIRTYYQFLDVDVDRYQIDGAYQQVMLAARELAPSLLPANAQTWVNLHLLFTHGNGVVMSPVTEKSAEGLPIFYLKDIPPVASGGPAITEPRIYFGQATDGYVIVKGSTPEFDYPKGKDNVYANYDGADGIAIGGAAWRSLFAWQFDDVNILLSRYHHQREQDHAPSQYPGSHRDDRAVPAARSRSLCGDQRRAALLDAGCLHHQRLVPLRPAAPGDINYIRNSVKVVIDAYNGTVTFYVMDTADPIDRHLSADLPELFKPFAAMPADLQQHIRYPEDLFRIQALQYRAYHMDTPEVFYNREDLWQFPREPTTSDGSNQSGGTRMAPYYIIMRLPGEPRAEFFLMLPMVAEPAREHDRLARGALRSARLRQAYRLRVPQGQARLRAVPDRGADQSEHRYFAADLAVESDGLAGASAEISWSCRSRTRSCMCRRCICAPSRASCRSSSG